VTGTIDDLEEIRSLGSRDLWAWLEGHASAAGSLQWWRGALGAIESRAAVWRGLPVDERREWLDVGARLLAVGDERGDIPWSLRAYWQLRLSVAGVRGGTEVARPPELLSAVGSVRWALDSLPASREEVIARARERAERFLAAGDDFYAPAGGQPGSLDAPDPSFALLQEVERVLSALEWIDLSGLDEGLRGEVEAWLALRNELHLS
jgi:hypothetical protein